MRDRSARRLAVSVWALSTVLVLGGAGLVVADWPLPLQIAEWGFPGLQGTYTVLLGAVGLPVALRKPANPIGWLLLAGASLSAVQFFGHQYALYGLVANPDSLPAPDIGAWLDEWLWVPILGLIAIYAFLLFPTGRLPSRRWRPVAWAAALGIALSSYGFAFAPGATIPGAVNPVAPSGDPAAAAVILAVGMALFLGSLAAASLSLVLRFRRAAGTERQQMKWLAYAGLLVATTFLFYVSVLVLFHEDGLAATGLAVTLLTIPIAIAIAVLRHRLFDVDLLINRTLVYGVLTAILAGVYAAGVLTFSQALGGFAQGDQLAVAGSTLIVAAIFRPILRRIQDAVDRRFYRARYDAQVTLEGFSAQLRDVVDLDSLTDALCSAVQQTMQPASASVWLKDR